MFGRGLKAGCRRFDCAHASRLQYFIVVLSAICVTDDWWRLFLHNHSPIGRETDQSVSTCVHVRIYRTYLCSYIELVTMPRSLLGILPSGWSCYRTYECQLSPCVCGQSNFSVTTIIAFPQIESCGRRL